MENSILFFFFLKPSLIHYELSENKKMGFHSDFGWSRRCKLIQPPSLLGLKLNNQFSSYVFISKKYTYIYNVCCLTNFWMFHKSCREFDMLNVKKKTNDHRTFDTIFITPKKFILCYCCKCNKQHSLLRRLF